MLVDISANNIQLYFFGSLFLANFQCQYLGNGLSDLLESFIDFDHPCGSKSVKFSSKSDKPFPRYRCLKMAKKTDQKTI